MAPAVGSLEAIEVLLLFLPFVKLPIEEIAAINRICFEKFGECGAMAGDSCVEGDGCWQTLGCFLKGNVEHKRQRCFWTSTFIFAF